MEANSTKPKTIQKLSLVFKKQYCTTILMHSIDWAVVIILADELKKARKRLSSGTA